MKKLILLFIIFLLASCKPTQLITNSKSHDQSSDANHQTVKHDSIYVLKHDSTIITQKGDTIKIQVFKYIYHDRYHNTTDTLKLKTTDYKKLTITKTVEVEKKLSWFQKLQIWLGRFVLLAFVFLVGFVIVRYIPKK